MVISVEIKIFNNLIVFFNYGNLHCIFYYNNVIFTFINIVTRIVNMFK